MATLSAVPFSALPVTDDGYTLLNDNGIVHRSSKKLSELVGDKTSSFLTKEQGDSLYQEKGDYLVEDDITGKLDKEQYANDSATFLTAHQPLDEYATKDWVEEQNYITGVDLTNYYTKSETSGKEEIEAALEEKQDILTFSGENNTITSINNSAVGGGGSTTGEYVPLSATACSIGNNTATAPQSFSQGVNNQCLGTESFTQGYGNSAYNGSFAQGRECYASNYSIAQGSNCSAIEVASQAFGRGTVISSVGMAIGQYNKTSANVAFVIGNGVASNRSDLFVIDKYGNVSAKNGYFYDKDGKVGGGSVGGAGGAYVPLNAVECTIGSGNSAISGSLAQGENNLAGYSIVYPEETIEGKLIPERTEVLGYSFAQGKENTAYSSSMSQGNHNEARYYAMAQGYNNVAEYSFAQGSYNSAYQNSFAQGEYNYAYDTGAGFGTRNSAIRYSFTQGETVSAKNYSFAAGKYNYAENYSQTFGYGLKATNYTTAQGYEYAIINYGSFVIGEFNKTSAAPFVIGNGTSDNDRRDLFVVDKDGNVSAQGQIYAEGGVLGASLDTLELAPDNVTIEFVTSSHNVVNGEGDPEEYTVIKIKTSLLNKINELYNLVSLNSGTSNWNLPQ